MSGLTRPQWALLEFLQRQLRETDHRVSPSYDEICRAMGWRSKSHVAAQLAVLAAKGFIRWQPTRQRSIELADGPIMLVLPADVAAAVRKRALAHGITAAAFIELVLRERLNLGSSPSRSVSCETSNSSQTDRAVSAVRSLLG